MKTQEEIYKILSKIKEPVLIAVSRTSTGDAFRKKLDRTRILRPNGHCSYAWEGYGKGYFGGFSRSCFNKRALRTTLTAMRDFDRWASHKIVGVVILSGKRLA